MKTIALVLDPEDIQGVIDINDYEGIRDQDGWETLILTVMNNHPSRIGTQIINYMQVKK